MYSLLSPRGELIRKSLPYRLWMSFSNQAQPAVSLLSHTSPFFKVAALKDQFPTPWDNATILSGDTEANSVWQSIQSSGIIPSYVQPKGLGE